MCDFPISRPVQLLASIKRMTVIDIILPPTFTLAALLCFWGPRRGPAVLL